MSKRTVLEDRQIAEDLIHRVSISKDEVDVYLNVDLMNGKYKIEKMFKNNFSGLYMLEVACGKFNTKEKIFDYLKIGETK